MVLHICDSRLACESCAPCAGAAWHLPLPCAVREALAPAVRARLLHAHVRILAERLSRKEIGLPPRQVSVLLPPEEVGVLSASEIKTSLGCRIPVICTRTKLSSRTSLRIDSSFAIIPPYIRMYASRIICSSFLSAISKPKLRKPAAHGLPHGAHPKGRG